MMYVGIPLRKETQIVGVIRTSIPLTAIDETVRAIEVKIAFGGLLIALFAAILSLWVSRRISRPIEEMKEGAEYFAGGDLGHRLAVPDSVEMGGLAQAMNQMASQLNDRIKAVIRQRNELEAVLSSMVEGVIAVDTDERIISMNQAAARMLGCAETSWGGKSIQEVSRNTDLQVFLKSTLNSQFLLEKDIGLHTDEERVLNARGTGTHGWIADGIYYAADNGADIINMSLGGSSTSSTMQDAVEYARDNGVVIVAASGNDGASVVSYPAAYDDYCIAVGATQYDETRAPYSNYGTALDIVAPGGNISVDQNTDGYADGVLQQTFGDTPVDWGYSFYQGTSMATPHAAGVAVVNKDLGFFGIGVHRRGQATDVPTVTHGKEGQQTNRRMFNGVQATPKVPSPLGQAFGPLAGHIPQQGACFKGVGWHVQRCFAQIGLAKLADPAIAHDLLDTAFSRAATDLKPLLDIQGIVHTRALVLEVGDRLCHRFGCSTACQGERTQFP